MDKYYKANYTAEDIAEFVINYHNKEGIEITQLRLQKILYFIQIYFCRNKGIFCFDDDFYKWEYGAVIPRIYHKYKYFGAGNIVINNFKHLNTEDEEIIKGIIWNLNKFRTTYLIKMLYETRPCEDTIKNDIINKYKIINYVKTELNDEN